MTKTTTTITLNAEDVDTLIVAVETLQGSRTDPRDVYHADEIQWELETDPSFASSLDQFDEESRYITKFLKRLERARKRIP